MLMCLRNGSQMHQFTRAKKRCPVLRQFNQNSHRSPCQTRLPEQRPLQLKHMPLQFQLQRHLTHP